MKSWIIFQLFFFTFFSSCLSEVPYLFFEPTEIQDGSFIYVLESNLPQNSVINEDSVADLLGHIVGLGVVNPGASRDNFPEFNFFEKPRANLLVILDSVDRDIVEKLSLDIFKNQAEKIEISKKFFPSDRLSTSTTFFTGFGPGSHGVKNSSWFIGKKKAEAFTSYETSPHLPTLADLLLKESEGKSLIISASLDKKLAFAFGCNPYEHDQLSTKNAFSLSWNEASSTFENSFADEKLNILMNSASLESALLKREQLSFDASTNQVRVQIRSVDASFDLSSEVDRSFITELELLGSLISSLTKTEMESFTNDNSPDLITFAFSSLKDLIKKYGKESKQVAASLYLVDAAVAKGMIDLKSKYQRIGTEIMLMSKPVYNQLQSQFANSGFKQQVFEVLKPYVNEKVFDASFPVVYLERVIYDGHKACEFLERKGLDSYDNIKLNCAVKYKTVEFLNKALDAEFSLNATNDDVAIYQIVLWGSILLVFIILAAVCTLCCMQNNMDSLLRVPITNKSR